MFAQIYAAEVRKFTSVRGTVGLLAGAIGFVALAAVAVLTSSGRAGGVSLASEAGAVNVFTASSSGLVFIAVLGVMSVAGEFRHSTIRTSIVAARTPGRLLGSKAAALASVAILQAVAAVAVVVAIAVPWYAQEGLSVWERSGALLEAAGTTVLTAIVYGLLGLAVGAVVRHQTAAIIIVVGWMFVVEGLLLLVWPDGYRWLPGGAASGLAGTTTDLADLLDPWKAAIVFAGYATAAVAAATASFLRRDIAE